MILESLITWSVGKELTEVVLPLLAVLWACFKGFDWIKAIRSKDLAHIKIGMESLQNSFEEKMDTLDKSVKDQTTAIVSELKEQRADFRTFYAPMALQAAPAIRARKTAPKR